MPQIARRPLQHDRFYGHGSADRLLDKLTLTTGFAALSLSYPRYQRWLLVYDHQSPGAPLGLLGFHDQGRVNQYLMIEPTHLVLCNCTKGRIIAPTKPPLFLILSNV